MSNPDAALIALCEQWRTHERAYPKGDAPEGLVELWEARGDEIERAIIAAPRPTTPEGVMAFATVGLGFFSAYHSYPDAGPIVPADLCEWFTAVALILAAGSHRIVAPPSGLPFAWSDWPGRETGP